MLTVCRCPAQAPLLRAEGDSRDRFPRLVHEAETPTAVVVAATTSTNFFRRISRRDHEGCEVSNVGYVPAIDTRSFPIFLFAGWFLGESEGSQKISHEARGYRYIPP